MSSCVSSSRSLGSQRIRGQQSSEPMGLSVSSSRSLGSQRIRAQQSSEPMGLSVSSSRSLGSQRLCGQQPLETMEPLLSSGTESPSEQANKLCPSFIPFEEDSVTLSSEVPDLTWKNILHEEGWKFNSQTYIAPLLRQFTCTALERLQTKKECHFTLNFESK